MKLGKENELIQARYRFMARWRMMQKGWSPKKCDFILKIFMKITGKEICRVKLPKLPYQNYRYRGNVTAL